MLVIRLRLYKAQLHEQWQCRGRKKSTELATAIMLDGTPCRRARCIAVTS
jgi:hypothetical protein